MNIYFLRILLLNLGAFCCSTAVIFINLSRIDPIQLAAFRMLVAALVLSPLFFRRLKTHRATFTIRHMLATILPAIMLSAHFMLWIMGARKTLIANGILLINLAPVVLPFLAVFLLKERITRAELGGTVFSLMGALVLTAGDFNMSPEYFVGDVLCLASMLAVSVYVVLARLNRTFPSIWLYVVPIYALGGTLCLITSLFFASPIQPYPPREIIAIIGLGIVPTVIGHSIIAHSLKHFRSQLVSVVSMSQFIYAAIMAWLLFDQLPSVLSYISAVLIVIGGWIVITRSEKSVPISNKNAEPV